MPHIDADLKAVVLTIECKNLGTSAGLMYMWMVSLLGVLLVFRILVLLHFSIQSAYKNSSVFLGISMLFLCYDGPIIYSKYSVFPGYSTTSKNVFRRTHDVFTVDEWAMIQHWKFSSLERRLHSVAVKLSIF